MDESNRVDADQEIRRLDEEWGNAASTKDLEAVVSFYADDGSLVWPDTAPVHGSAAIRTAWMGVFHDYQGLKLKFTPERIDISESGDLASDYGRVDFGYDGDAGPVQLIAKYVVVWKRVNREWKVLYDCYNMNEAARQ
jgi:uncharacterized protein (TIGR02246 family)